MNRNRIIAFAIELVVLGVLCLTLGAKILGLLVFLASVNCGFFWSRMGGGLAITGSIIGGALGLLAGSLFLSVIDENWPGLLTYHGHVLAAVLGAAAGAFLCGASCLGGLIMTKVGPKCEMTRVLGSSLEFWARISGQVLCVVLVFVGCIITGEILHPGGW